LPWPKNTARPATQTAQAARWLTDRLADGPAEAADLLHEAQQHGFARSTVHRAAKELGVKKRRRGKNGDASTWSLVGFDPDRRM